VCVCVYAIVCVCVRLQLKNASCRKLMFCVVCVCVCVCVYICVGVCMSVCYTNPMNFECVCERERKRELLAA